MAKIYSAQGWLGNQNPRTNVNHAMVIISPAFKHGVNMRSHMGFVQTKLKQLIRWDDIQEGMK